jgi:hypothetical protein
MTYSSIRSLGRNDVFFDGWNESYVVPTAMWNNSKTQFFRITTERVRLGCEMVASIFVAYGVYHHIGFARMIMDFQFIILDQL